jgi:A/G-specific adenine glycosylase
MKAKLPPAQLKTFQKQMLRWFRAHKRDLPWRASRDPYRVWLAEVMLQQTRIAAVMPYYDRFLKSLPDVQSLANAPISEVLKLWSGLGYYSRARNLHRAAREIVQHRGGNFPRTLDAALQLPGIGRYTAGAVLSIAYDVPLSVLDGNVARVLARLRAVRGDLREPRRWRELANIAQDWLACDSPGDWNQALMELGEIICTPQIPRCTICPVSKWCRAYKLGLADKIPVPRVKRATVRMRIAAAILRDPHGRTILVKDPGAHDHVLFSRMWQFPAVEVTRHPQAELQAHLHATLGIDSLSLTQLRTARHAVTFRNITLLPYLAQVERLPKVPRTRILSLENLSRVPISNATRKIAAALVCKEKAYQR